MVRNFGERRKKRRGHSKKPKTKAPQTTSPSKSDQDVSQEAITCREMVVYVPKDTDVQQQQKRKSPRRGQGQCNCSLSRNPHRHTQRNLREGGRFFIDDEDEDEDAWEDVDDDDDAEEDIREILMDHMIGMIVRSLAMSSVRRRNRGRQEPLIPGFFLPFFMRH